MNPIQEELTRFLLDKGVSDVGYAAVPDANPPELRYAVSIVLRLSDAIVEEITQLPTHSYFHHYRSVNTKIDSILLDAGLFLQEKGYRYIPIAASQTINDDGWHYHGRYSHKKAACLSGLGTIGKHTLFLHRDYGCRVRLGTLFTDCPLETTAREAAPCIACNACVRACPAGALTGAVWTHDTPREAMFDPEKCSRHMKANAQDIGRGAVCGVCMKVCPAGKANRR